MPDAEKVIKGIEICSGITKESSEECPYWKALDMGCKSATCISTMMREARTLLKEQEPVRVGKKIKAGDIVLDFYECGYCKNAIRKPWIYCPFCGRKVKWE